MKKRKNTNFVLLGGGIGTVNLLRGIKEYSKNITVVVSMADDGGSGGRLRRLFSIPPPGDLMNCLAALSETEPTVRKLLLYRFAGNRWGRDDSLAGQKLGNLILVALSNITGSFESGLEEAQRLFLSHGQIIPATCENVSIWAKTCDGKKVFGEQNIDLGKYDGTRTLAEVHLEPKNVTTPKKALQAITEADVIIAGPGDLYTTVLPVLLVSDIQKTLKRTRAKKIFVVNVANKPFETPNYSISDFAAAIYRHLNDFPFPIVLVNKNFKPKMPKHLNYTYVALDKLETIKNIKRGTKIIAKDVIDEGYPLYHNSQKLARVIMSLL